MVCCKIKIECTPFINEVAKDQLQSVIGSNFSKENVNEISKSLFFNISKFMYIKKNLSFVYI